MNTKGLFTKLAMAVLVLSMAACSALPVTGLSLSVVSTGANSETQSKLAVGILKLQDTDLAVDAVQSAELLPLWKAIKSLNNDINTTDAEMQALYDQIEENLTSAQLTAISEMVISDSDISSLKSASGIVNTIQESSSSQSTSSSASGGGMPGGDMGGGAPAGDMGGGDMGGMLGADTSTASSQSSGSQTSSTGSSAQDLNLMFAESVITLLQNNVNA